MKIIVKVLQGQEYAIEVTGQTRVSEVKEQLDKLLGVPVLQQKLLFTGRPLTDEKLLSDYPTIKDGTKLNLIVKQEKQETSSKKLPEKPSSGEQDLTVLKDAAYKFLRDFYSEAETKRIVDEFGKEFLRSVSTLSLDDYERIATSCLEEENQRAS
ncbi:ubiquitin-like protein 4A [Macrosteles quadrilineatus]|uniref:ubiquitin-like protein 4A n=1 Tax=Macrosteles quadrilineatus TaxID=74068 RepID=UPI0023E0F65A|nr:ubiquitin-like protein 4A [Macrosteles quadrilineatus]XP_054286903.1 ubiquitin-like protein 4A [Macrosteles quadrilineatus]